MHIFNILSLFYFNLNRLITPNMHVHKSYSKDLRCKLSEVRKNLAFNKFNLYDFYFIF